MKFENLALPDAFWIRPDLFEDDRGVFRRHFCQNEFKEAGIHFEVKQTNVSENFHKGTLRGFHYQEAPYGEDKVLTLYSGSIYNVMIDLRPESKKYLQWVDMIVDSKKRESLFIPKGCANCFLTLEDNTNVFYLMGNFFSPENYFGIRYNDPYFNIPWPSEPKYISDKDKNFPNYKKP